MNNSWHLLLENLKNNPELLEEEGQNDVFALSAEEKGAKKNKDNTNRNTADRKNHLIMSLQKKYGNQGLQKLLSNKINHSADIEEKGKANTNTQSAPQKPADETIKETSMVTSLAQDTTASAEKINIKTNLEIENIKTTPPDVRGREKNIAQEDKEHRTQILQSNDALSEKRINALLLLFSQGLPRPSENLISSINQQYINLGRLEQAYLIAKISSHARQLPNVQKAVFLTALKIVSSTTKGNEFLLALLASLLGISSQNIVVVEEEGEE